MVNKKIYSREYWENLAKKLNVQFTYVQQRSLQSKITYTCGSWCLLYLYNKSRNEIEKTDKYRIINEKFKRKINNDIKLKKKKIINLVIILNRYIIKNAVKKKIKNVVILLMVFTIKKIFKIKLHCLLY